MLAMLKMVVCVHVHKNMTEEIAPAWECLICRSEFVGSEPKSLSALSCKCMRDRVGSCCDECIGKHAHMHIKEGALPRCMFEEEASKGHIVPSLPALLDALLAKGLITPEIHEIGVKRALDVSAAMEAELARRLKLGIKDGDSTFDYLAVYRASLVDEDHPSISFSGECPKRCPFCGIACIRIEGCRHMTCFTCNNDFRWCCAAKGTECYEWCCVTDEEDENRNSDNVRYYWECGL